MWYFFTGEFFLCIWDKKIQTTTILGKKISYYFHFMVFILAVFNNDAKFAK